MAPAACCCRAGLLLQLLQARVLRALAWMQRGVQLAWLLSAAERAQGRQQLAASVQQAPGWEPRLAAFAVA